MGGGGGVVSPERSLPALQVVLQDDAGHRAALPHASTVSDQEACSLVVLQDHLVLLGRGGGGGGGRRGGGRMGGGREVPSDTVTYTHMQTSPSI